MLRIAHRIRSSLSASLSFCPISLLHIETQVPPNTPAEGDGSFGTPLANLSRTARFIAAFPIAAIGGAQELEE